MIVVADRRMFGIKIGGQYWCLKSPWLPAYFHERNGLCKVYPLGFGWRITRQPHTDQPDAKAPSAHKADLGPAGATTVVAKDEWTLVGASSRDSIIAKGGDRPIAIRVSHNDSADLLRLIRDANDGIASRHFPVLHHRQGGVEG